MIEIMCHLISMGDQDSYDDVHPDGAVDGFDVKYIDVNGVETRYYEEGAENDETLLLVHGGAWGGSSSANGWTPVLSGLSEHFHVLAPDRLACGMTDNPTPESGYEWEFESELRHVRDFLEAKGIDECHVCGNSRGMGAASWIAVNHPDQVNTIICVNSHTLSPEVGDYGHRRAMLAQDVPSETGTREELERRLEKIAAYWSYNPERTYSSEHISAKAYMSTRPKAEQAADVMKDGGKQRIEREGKFEVMDEIRGKLRDGVIQQPILLYWGRHDLTSTLEQGLTLYEDLSQGNPNVRMHIVDRAGHLVFQVFPDEFVSEVVSFITHWKDKQYDMDDVRPRAYAEYWKSDGG
jgi:pimeloyl-ACP methyl ester carboxylesterase